MGIYEIPYTCHVVSSFTAHVSFQAESLDEALEMYNDMSQYDLDQNGWRQYDTHAVESNMIIANTEMLSDFIECFDDDDGCKIQEKEKPKICFDI